MRRENPKEGRRGGESALVADMRDRNRRIVQEPECVGDPYFMQMLEKAFSQGVAEVQFDRPTGQADFAGDVHDRELRIFGVQPNEFQRLQER